MSDDQSSRSQGNKSWLERISQAFSSGPESVEDVLEILRDAESQSIIDTDSMSIIVDFMQSGMYIIGSLVSADKKHL